MSIPNSLLNMTRKNFYIYMGLICGSAILLALAAYENWHWPEGDYWPYIYSDVLTIIPSIGAAIASTLLFHEFEPGDKPRAIWLLFALGWWAWVVGEVCSLGYDVFNIPYGEISVYDIFWTAGYIFFGLSLFYQFVNIYPSKKKAWLVYFIPGIAITLLITLGFTLWALAAGLGEDLSFFALYLAVFYPVCDVLIGVTALWLVFLFGRGTWGRPWWGLIVFAVADALNIYLWIGGENYLTESTNNFLNSLSNTIYNAGYMVAMLGFFFILLHNFWNRVDTPEGQVA